MSKRVASSNPEGDQPVEKAVKQGDADLLGLLRIFTEAEDKVVCWKNVLYERDVVCFDDLVVLARDPGWDGFLGKLRNDDQDVLASKLYAWRNKLAVSNAVGGDSFSFFFFLACLLASSSGLSVRMVPHVCLL